MASKFLLPCECGQGIPVEPSQAGQVLTCACGRQLEVPSMREVRLLEPHEGAEESAPSARREWNVTAGAVFATGAVIVVIGLLFAAMCTLYQMELRLEVPPPEVVEEYAAQVELATPSVVLDVWNETVDSGLGEYWASPFVISRERSRFFGQLASAGFTLAGLGLLTVVVAVFLRRKSRK